MLLLRLFCNCGEQGLLRLWRVGFSLRWLLCFRAQASVVAAPGLSSCGSQALEYRLNSVALGLRCFEACGIVSDQGSKL